MNIDEFIRLSQWEKVTKLCQKPVLLNFETETEVHELFHFDSFFVEAKYSKEKQNLISIDQFTALTGLNSYLESLPLSSLY